MPEGVNRDRGNICSHAASVLSLFFPPSDISSYFISARLALLCVWDLRKCGIVTLESAFLVGIRRKLFRNLTPKAPHLTTNVRGGASGRVEIYKTRFEIKAAAGYDWAFKEASVRGALRGFPSSLSASAPPHQVGDARSFHPCADLMRLKWSARGDSQSPHRRSTRLHIHYAKSFPIKQMPHA